MYFRCNVPTLWDLWWRGKPAGRIRGFRALVATDLQQESDRRLLSKAKCVIRSLLLIGNKSETEILALSPAESDALVLDLMVKLLKRVDPKYEDELDPMKDIGSLKFPYIYNLISKHKGKNTSAAT